VNRRAPKDEVAETARVRSDVRVGGNVQTTARQAQPGDNRWRLRRARFSLAYPRLRWWVEILIIGFGYLMYEFIQGSAPSDHDDAFTNSHDINRLEHWLHVDAEHAVNHFVNARPFLASLTGYYYDTMHYFVTPVVLLYLWFWRRDAYARWRSALVSASLAALFVYWLYPVAPPRLALHDITDTLVTRHIFTTTAAGGSGNLVNQFAAMPSLHVGWALWCAAAVVYTSHSPWRHLAWLYPIATTLVVMGTGNHYLLDGVGGVAFIMLGVVATQMRPVRSAGDAEQTITTDPAGLG
jgi:PAP2 superfamily